MDKKQKVASIIVLLLIVLMEVLIFGSCDDTIFHFWIKFGVFSTFPILVIIKLAGDILKGYYEH